MYVCVSFNSQSPCLRETVKIESVFSFVVECGRYLSSSMLSGIACYIKFEKLRIMSAQRGCFNTPAHTQMHTHIVDIVYI